MYLSVCLLLHYLQYALFDRNWDIIGPFIAFACFILQCVDFAENALFKSYGVICLSLPCSTVPDKLSMNRSNSDGFFLRRRFHKVSDISGKLTDSLLFVKK